MPHTAQCLITQTEVCHHRAFWSLQASLRFSTTLYSFLCVCVNHMVKSNEGLASLPTPNWTTSVTEHLLYCNVHTHTSQVTYIVQLHTWQADTSTQNPPHSNQQPHLWPHIIILTSWMAIINTVLSEKLLLQRSKRSSKLGPSSSSTIALYLPHGPK